MVTVAWCTLFCMQIGKTLYLTNRTAWRAWLRKHHKTAGEIWLIYYHKATGKPSIPYADAVEEALCYGWIDSIEKNLDSQRSVQRYSPRKKGSNLSDINRARVKKMIAAHKMTKAGLAAIAHAYKPTRNPVK
jgi:uncharacterized protein YdeI (YjbR/CyaY-like superfamily)